MKDKNDTRLIERIINRIITSKVVSVEKYSGGGLQSDTTHHTLLKLDAGDFVLFIEGYFSTTNYKKTSEYFYRLDKITTSFETILEINREIKENKKIVEIIEDKFLGYFKEIEDKKKIKENKKIEENKKLLNNL